MAGPVIDMSQFGAPVGAPAQSREVRGEEADIGQTQASTAASAASAERTRAMTPVDIERTRGQAVTEEATRPAAIRLGEAQADAAELRADTLRRALASSQTAASGRLFGEDLASAERELQTTIGNLLQARRLSRDMFSASGFGHATMRDYGPGGSPAADVAALISQISSFTALERLMELKSDPRNETGGALGAISAPELQMLVSSAGNLNAASSDTEFQAGIDDVLAKALDAYNKLGGDPYAVAQEFLPDEIEQYLPLLRSWRALPEDEQTILRYANESRADGSFDPTTFAQLQAEAYARATGKPADEAFLSNALTQAQEMQARPGAIQALDYGGTDEALREDLTRRVYAQEQDGVDLSGAIGGGAINLIPSTFQLAGDTVQALTLDLPQTLAGIVDVVAGATGMSDDPTAYEAVKNYYTTRYGTKQGFADALRTDPAGILADVVGVATLGGTTAAKALGTVGRVTRIAELANAARAAEGFTSFASRFDPLRVAAGITQRGTGLAGRTARQLGTEIPARVAGAPAGAVEQAVGAGRRGSAAFTEQMEGAPNAPNPLDQLDRAVSELYDRRSLEYQDARNRLNLNERVPFTEIDRALLDTRSVGRYRDIDYRRAPQAWAAANDIVENFRSRGYDSVEAVDAMKQQIGALRDTFPLGSPERGVVQDVYNGVRGAITQSAPEYAKMMEDYGAASDALTDIRASLSTNAASPDTTLRRLQQQVAGTGPRGRTVLDIVEGTQSGRGLGDAVAGMALSSDRPSGVTSSLAPTAAMAGEPTALMALTATPRSVGRRAYGVGSTFGKAERAVNAVTGAPIVAGQSLADLARNYAIPAMQPMSAPSQALRVANPAVIQPLVNPVEAPPETPYTEEERLMIRNEAPRTLPPAALLGASPSGTSIDRLSEQYGISRPAPAAGPPAMPSIEALAQQYGAGAAPALPSGTPGEVREINGRIAVFDPTADSWVDADTGAPIFGEGYNRGGRVIKRPAPTRALKG